MKNISSIAIILIILEFILSGCATTKGYEQSLQTWVGSSEAQLVRSWGVPAQVYQSGGIKYLAYNSSRNVYLPGSAPSYTTTIIGNTAYTNSYGGSASKNLEFQCVTTFEISNEKVSSWSYKGNDCTAPEVGQDKYNYETKMRSVASQISGDKKYTRIALNTQEKKDWFKDLTFRLWSGKINKSSFIAEGLKYYPTHEYEFKFIADRLI